MFARSFRSIFGNIVFLSVEKSSCLISVRVSVSPCLVDACDRL